MVVAKIRGTLGELMAKKVVGGVMIIQKNADARTHPRPPAWTRKDLDAQSTHNRFLVYC